ncbi:MAG TPA: CheR family methyltransferase, partial [Prosthecobacter sp.]
RGGLTVAQDPDEAEHAGMPASAIDTGMVDWVLPVAQMAQRLLNYFHQEKRLQLPPEEGPQPAQQAHLSPDQAEAALREVLAYLRTRTGRDFSYYKRATILRRIARRMQVNAMDNVPAYLGYLRTHPGEAGALLQDLLISVTNFFRDREAFAVLEKHIPQLFEGKGHGEPVRVWVPACATGEEAYSIAMLLQEHARTLDSPPPLQVFACDLDEEAIAVARAGLYPESMVADVSEDRVRKFFVKDHRGYRGGVRCGRWCCSPRMTC